jgi:hypothetical protein
LANTILNDIQNVLHNEFSQFISDLESAEIKGRGYSNCTTAQAIKGWSCVEIEGMNRNLLLNKFLHLLLDGRSRKAIAIPIILTSISSFYRNLGSGIRSGISDYNYLVDFILFIE